ncbi:MAG: deoxyribodipyrimidine photo-lyase, partial [Arenimonas sp.]
MAQAIVWFRRDLRLADNPALQAALDAGLSPIPLYIYAPEEEAPWAPGAASQAWLHKSLNALAADLMGLGSRLIIRRGPSLAALEQLLDEGEIAAVFWNRLYEPHAIARDLRVELALQARGVQAASFNAALLVEPWTITTGKGEPYRVFTPFWRKASQRVAGQLPLVAPASLPPVSPSLASVCVDALQLRPRVGWDADFWKPWQPGEAGARDLLDAFVEGAARGYAEQRNFPDRTGSSKLSPHLHFGEISARQICARLAAESWPADTQADVSRFLGELGWREFSHHLLFHFPHSCDQD